MRLPLFSLPTKTGADRGHISHPARTFRKSTSLEAGHRCSCPLNLSSRTPQCSPSRVSLIASSAPVGATLGHVGTSVLYPPGLLPSCWPQHWLATGSDRWLWIAVSRSRRDYKAKAEAYASGRTWGDEKGEGKEASASPGQEGTPQSRGEHLWAVYRLTT